MVCPLGQLVDSFNIYACAHSPNVEAEYLYHPDVYPLYGSLIGYGCNEFPINSFTKGC
jgi:hypothetical protein